MNMKLKTIVVLMSGLLLAPSGMQAQKKKDKKEPEPYKFTELARVPTTPVKNQQHTGTCWCFATTSFVETELLRMGKPELDLSEMFTVRQAYLKKADRYVRYHGMANFGPGGQAHDVMNVIREYGFVPESVYEGKNYGSAEHNHGELGAVLQGMLDGVVKGRRGTLTPAWPKAFEAVLDTYLGPYPASFTYDGVEYTPKSFAESTEFNPDDYVEITSYSHYPFYQMVNLEVPDNWSDDLYLNLPMDDMMAVINNALMNGYSVAWDGDVSEGTFSHKDGLAILPVKAWEDKSEQEKENTYKTPEPEQTVTQEMREKTFDNYATTDDHLMHLVGIVQDQKGTRYYITKNSWGTESNKMGGFLNMSDPYVRLKTIAIMVHRDAIPEEIMNKLKRR